MHPLLPLVLAAVLAASAAAAPQVIVVGTANEFREALSQLRPGVTLRLRPGEYGHDHSIRHLAGTAQQPITIEAVDAGNRPSFTGGNVALHVQGCSFLTLRHLRFQQQTGNGLNVDDIGSPAHHLTLEGIEVADVGPTGNHDGIKLSGLTDFTVRDCRLSGWGGQGIDMVGCHRGLIVGCHFEGKPAFSQTAGVQAKGGSEDITIRACRFVDAGQRAAQLGGSTGRPYFRPPDAAFEARRITLEGCLILGSMTPVAFAGVDAAVVRFNTMVNPTTWALRILQENQDPRMIPCRNGRFENNLIAVDTGALRTWINIGEGTEPESFQFTGNWWFHRGPGQPAKPTLPAPERDGVYGTDPRLDHAAGYHPGLPAAQRAGHTAFKP